MKCLKRTVAAIVVMGSTAVEAAEWPAHEQLKQELTVGIPAGGVVALERLRQDLIKDLPGGVPVPSVPRPLHADKDRQTTVPQI